MMRTMGTEIRTWLPKPFIMGATAYVISNDAPTLVKFFGRVCRQLGLQVWVCDGTADQVEINAAITGSLNPTTGAGGLVHLLGGHFIINGSILANQYGLTLQAMRYGSYIVLDNGSNCNMIYISKSRVTLRDLHLEGNSANQASGNGIQIGTAGEAAPNAVADTHIINTHVGDCKGHGILMANSAGILPGSAGLYCDMVFSVANLVNGWDIEYTADIRLTQCNAQSNLNHGFYFENGNECYLSNVSADANGSIGGAVEQSGFRFSNCYRISLTNFWAGLNKHRGVSIQGGYEISVVSGSVYKNSTDSDALNNELNLYNTSRAIVSDVNIFTDTAGRHGIRLMDTVKRSIITNNTIIVPVYCLYLFGIDLDKNTIVRNYLESTTSAVPIYPPSTSAYYPLPSTIIYEGHVDLFMDVLAASANHVRAAQDLSLAIPITFTIDAQPDAPRTITWAFVAHVNITAYTMEIVGVDARHNTRTVTWTETAGWSGETSIAFAIITSIKMTARTGTGVGDTMNVGIGSKLGLSDIIYATDYVMKIKKNNADYPPASYTVNTANGTVDVSPGGAIVGGDDYTIWFHSNLNILS